MPRLRIAFGPEAPGFGSWEWIGLDLCQALAELGCRTETFSEAVPDCDVLVFVKFKPPVNVLETLRQHCRLVFCPVDVYGSAAEIDSDAAALRCIDRIVVHCERLRKYFTPYTTVAYLDHHLKFIADPPPAPRSDGPLLWIGNRSNLPPVVDWVNRHPLPSELWVLTDFPAESLVPPAKQLGLRDRAHVRIDRWTPDRHRAWTAEARAAFDVKGDDFRARHKPPTKALDFLASGMPLMMQADSSSAEHLRTVYNFQIAALGDWNRWLSAEFWRDVQRVVPRLRSELSLEEIARRFLSLAR